MYSLLLLTKDIPAHEHIVSAAESIGIRTRVVSTFESANDWLSRYQFNVILADLSLGTERVEILLNHAWKYSASINTGVFCSGRPPIESWNLTLLGTQIFYGPTVFEDIAKFLQSLPKSHELTNAEHSAVLFVEDLDSPRDIVEAYITALGFPYVDAVPSAKEALKKLELAPERYFCIIVDIHMPVMNGIRLTEEIRSTPKFAHIPVVMLTADPSIENVVASVRAGATGFLAKPPKKKELLRELEKAKRILMNRQSPRLCAPDEADMLMSSLRKNS